MEIKVRVEPIENAPKDGSYVVAIDRGKVIRVFYADDLRAGWYMDHWSYPVYPTHYLPDGFPEILTATAEENPLASRRFEEATAEEFRRFFEGEGWEYDGTIWDVAERVPVGETLSIQVMKDGWVAIYNADSDRSISFRQFDTFGAALTATNTIADALGGWA